MADKSHIEPHRHHLGLRLALAVQQIEAILQEREEVIGGEKSSNTELRVVCAPGVRNDQVRRFSDPNPVLEVRRCMRRNRTGTRLLDKEPSGIDARSIPAVPAQRALPTVLPNDSTAGVCGDAPPLRQLELPHPAPAVAADIVAGRDDGLGRRGVPLQKPERIRTPSGKTTLSKDSHEPPEADAAPILEHGLGGEVAASDRLAGSSGFGERRFGKPIPVRYGILGAFLIVHHDVER